MSDTPDKTESKVEAAKRASRHLRGTIEETLRGEAPGFSEADGGLLKFHGIYQQDDRDVRQERRKAGLGEKTMFMVRLAIPGGGLSADQYLRLDELADGHEIQSLRVTTRQGLQFHGVLKDNLKHTIASVNQALLTTISACGDVERNVMTCPAPLGDRDHVRLHALAGEIARDLRPASRAYYEIWLDEEKVVSTEGEEPFYGEQYLPRKFKTGIALASDNCIDVYTYDCGLVAITDGPEIRGFNLIVAGGLGLTHNKPDTFAALGPTVGFIKPQYAVQAVRAVCTVFRDYGNRVDRRHARLKYLLEQWGLERFREEFVCHIPFELAPPVELPRPGFEDHLGPHRQSDGRMLYGIYIENGRIIDRDDCRMKSALRTIMREHQPRIRLTPHQNMLLLDLSDEQITSIEATVRDHGVRLVQELSAARRYSMACPALPTCGLSMAESERIMPSVVDGFETELERLGLRDAPITLRMTGCPNGCSRPYTADIAFVGRRPDVYHVYVGGGLPGTRMADLYAADVATGELVHVLRPLLEAWAARRGSGESLGDFYQRVLARSTVRRTITGKEEATEALVQLGIERLRG